jgi:uncharacterized protein YndB with AHSA1/START domain
MTELPYRLDRTVVIHAARESVFRFFTDSARWAKWWGAGSTIDARPGGPMRIRYPEGTEAEGEVLEVLPPERIVFTYGFSSGKPIPPGGSRVTIRLEAHTDGTQVHLSHEFAEEKLREEFVQGWRFQLSLFANVVADEVNAGAAGLVDTWFGAWSISEDAEREQALARVAAPEVEFHDRFSLLNGLADLVVHIGASQRFMPGMRLQRNGDVRHCQGTVLADWVALSNDGKERGRGTNVFVLGADGRIASATGFWSPPA